MISKLLKAGKSLFSKPKCDGTGTGRGKCKELSPEDRAKVAFKKQNDAGIKDYTENEGKLHKKYNKGKN